MSMSAFFMHGLKRSQPGTIICMVYEQPAVDGRSGKLTLHSSSGSNPALPFTGVHENVKFSGNI